MKRPALILALTPRMVFKLANDGITSNKWMRANYGRSHREFFLKNGRFSQLIDFGDSPIFENATTYTNIALWNKETDDSGTCHTWDLSRSYTNDDSLPSMLGATERSSLTKQSTTNWSLQTRKV